MSATEKRFPVDGPHTAKRFLEAAHAVQDCVRYLNHSMYHQRKVLPDAASGYMVVGALANPSLGQLLDDLTQWVQRLAIDPALQHAGPHYDDESAYEAATAAADSLRDAAVHAKAMAALLHAAQSHLSPLYNEES